MMDTPITYLYEFRKNKVFIKRDDLLPFSFGGNKARKAELFFREILKGPYDCVVTYGSGSSNHCRVVANLSAKYNLKCYIVSAEEAYTETVNSILVSKFGANIVKAPLNEVSLTIDALLSDLSKEHSPYFIQGGGHGNIGTQAYVNAYNEICKYEDEYGISFDYIFLASGTGTTQAGLVCGAAVKGHMERRIVGISIARRNPRGAQVVDQSIRDYLNEENYHGAVPNVIFDDSYVCGGYGKYNDEVADCVNKMIEKHGIPMSTTYTGKAFWGMEEYIRKNEISKKNILFLHTGGVPLFFDDLKRIGK